MRVAGFSRGVGIIAVLYAVQVCAQTGSSTSFLDPSQPAFLGNVATSELSRKPSVTFHNGWLTVDAIDTSLGQVLDDIRFTTGAVIEFPPSANGERAIVKLGPGSITNVLADLLTGSPFDYSIVGGDSTSDFVHAVLWDKVNEEPGPNPTSNAAGYNFGALAHTDLSMAANTTSLSSINDQNSAASLSAGGHGAPGGEGGSSERPRKLVHRPEGPRSFSLNKHP